MYICQHRRSALRSDFIWPKTASFAGVAEIGTRSQFFRLADVSDLPRMPILGSPDARGRQFLLTSCCRASGVGDAVSNGLASVNEKSSRRPEPA
jgi:hypothetical protein